MPAGWITRAAYPVLVAYCEAVEGAERVELAIRAFKPKKPGSRAAIVLLADLLDVKRKQAALVASLATKLRLTPQSRYTPKAAATAAGKSGARKPWEVDESSASGQ